MDGFDKQIYDHVELELENRTGSLADAAKIIN
jgi:hypothetical protein